MMSQNYMICVNEEQEILLQETTNVEQENETLKKQIVELILEQEKLTKRLHDQEGQIDFLQADLEVMAKTAIELHVKVGMIHDSMVVCNESLTQLYQAVCVVLGEMPDHDTLERVKAIQSFGDVDQRPDQQFARSMTTSLKSEFGHMLLLTHDIYTEEAELFTIQEEQQNQPNSTTEAKLRKLLTAKRQQISHFRKLLKNNKATTETVLKDLREKYEKEKREHEETLKELQEYKQCDKISTALQEKFDRKCMEKAQELAAAKERGVQEQKLEIKEKKRESYQKIQFEPLLEEDEEKPKRSCCCDIFCCLFS